MNFGPQPRHLDEYLKSGLDSYINSGSKVIVTSVMGDGEAFNFANQVKLYLQSKGFDVDGVNQAIFSMPIRGQIIEPPKDGDSTFKIIIGNNI